MTVGNWGRWGAEDEIGSLNLITPDVVRRGAGMVTSGQVLSLAQPLGPGAAVAGHRGPAARFMDRDAGDYALGARSPGGFRFSEDTILMSTHSGTHLDSLAHAWEGDQLYNGHPASTIRSTAGAQRCGADKLKPVVTRGILIDLVALTGRFLHPSESVSADMLHSACAATGTILKPGDAALIRTGWAEQARSAADYHASEPGLNLEAAKWLTEQDVSIVGSDNYAVEVQPSAPDTAFPVHLHMLHRHGTPLIENLMLAELAQAKQSEFLFVVAPLPLAGSTASPATPLAIL